MVLEAELGFGELGKAVAAGLPDVGADIEYCTELGDHWVHRVGPSLAIGVQ